MSFELDSDDHFPCTSHPPDTNLITLGENVLKPFSFLIQELDLNFSNFKIDYTLEAERPAVLKTVDTILSNYKHHSNDELFIKIKHILLKCSLKALLHTTHSCTGYLFNQNIVCKIKHNLSYVKLCTLTKPEILEYINSITCDNASAFYFFIKAVSTMNESR